VELFDEPRAAIAREKQLKKWNRDWKIALIEQENPDWLDLTPDLI
jgi:putative endonuclease